MKKTLKVIGLCLLALYVGYTLYYLWQQSQPVPTVYELVSPERRTLMKRTTVAGSMEARRQVTVKPQVTGVVSRLAVEPGDKVKAGQVIIDYVQKYYSQYVFHASAEAKFKLATLGNDAGIFGAAKLVLE